MLYYDILYNNHFVSIYRNVEATWSMSIKTSFVRSIVCSTRIYLCVCVREFGCVRVRMKTVVKWSQHSEESLKIRPLQYAKVNQCSSEVPFSSRDFSLLFLWPSFSKSRATRWPQRTIHLILETSLCSSSSTFRHSDTQTSRMLILLNWAERFQDQQSSFKSSTPFFDQQIKILSIILP